MIDTILEQHSDIFLLFRDDIIGNSSGSQFGRGDVPSVEQIVREAIYEEMKGTDSRELADAKMIPGFVPNLLSWTRGNLIVFRCSRAKSRGSNRRPFRKFCTESTR